MTLYEDLTTILGGLANGSFYLQAFPQEHDLPCIVFRFLTEDPATTVCGYAGTTYYEVTFECFAVRQSDADLLAMEVKSVLDSTTSLVKRRVSVAGEDYEPITDHYMQPVNYGFYY